jgi:branched-chain amino acid transport system substrate-binding protein
MFTISRRGFLAAGSVAAAGSIIPNVYPAWAATPLKLGLILPFSSVYAKLGEEIAQGLELALAEEGGTVAGRSVEVIKQDTEVNPKTAIQGANRLVKQEAVDFLVGPVSSAVAAAIRNVAHNGRTHLIVANAGHDGLSQGLCSPFIYRTSFSNWQVSAPMGTWMYKQGIRRVMLAASNYAGGTLMLKHFSESFQEAGGEIAGEVLPDLKEIQYAPFLEQIRNSGAEAVFCFFAGNAAVEFVKQYSQFGLQGNIPLYGCGFLTTSDVRPAQGEASEGIRTTLHYAETLDNPQNTAFRQAFQDRYGSAPSLYAVQGYDSGRAIVEALKTTDGNTEDKEALSRALDGIALDSPRGRMAFSRNHDPVQDIYVLEVQNGQNVVIDTAAKSLTTPTTDCTL